MRRSLVRKQVIGLCRWLQTQSGKISLRQWLEPLSGKTRTLALLSKQASQDLAFPVGPTSVESIASILEFEIEKRRSRSAVKSRIRDLKSLVVLQRNKLLPDEDIAWRFKWCQWQLSAFCEYEATLRAFQAYVHLAEPTTADPQAIDRIAEELANVNRQIAILKDALAQFESATLVQR